MLIRNEPIQESRSKEKGRYTVWRLKGGLLVERWFTESELRTFTNWKAVEEKIDAAKAALPPEPPSINQPAAPPQADTTSPIASSQPTSTAMPTAPASTPVQAHRIGVILCIAIILAASLLFGARAASEFLPSRLNRPAI